ncbi:hypothetical protein BXZ70DRAFT_1051449 [Cristinia sonorae]|uniref:Uncharacterized protein n=1 Tax=Cristinia sonorae TaxID=1940300 RepID=A0A8K0UT46_9AGAR|nr:hypothetical protein BXZ70DRAFT_1051449 [Cristinia sonorae]
MSDAIVLPNPFTPLAWLPKDIADQMEASRYLYSATIGAWLWDFLMSFPDEMRMFKQYGFGLTDFVYVGTSSPESPQLHSSFAHFYSKAIAPIPDCHALAKTIGWLAAVSLPLNCLLFFFRIRALFHGNNVVIAFFGVLWLSTLATITAPFGVDGAHMGNTRFCVNTAVKEYASVGFIVGAVHDTIVFLTITTKLSTHSTAGSWKGRFQAFVSGGGMGSVSRALLKTGQLYYLVTVGMNILTLALILSPPVPPVIRAMFTIPDIALQNAMTCRVHRLLKLGLLREDGDSTVPSRTPPGMTSSQRFNNSTMRSGALDAMELSARPQKPVVVNVEVDRERDFDRDGSMHAASDKTKWNAGDYA